jgi:hypothetical protein
MVKKFMRATSEQVSTDEPFTFGKSVWNNLLTLTWTWKRDDDDVELLGCWCSHIGHAVGGHGNDRLPVNNSPSLHAKLPCHKFIIIMDGGNFDRVNTEGCALLDSFDMCPRLFLNFTAPPMNDPSPTMYLFYGLFTHHKTYKLHNKQGQGFVILSNVLCTQPWYCQFRITSKLMNI